MHQEHTPLEMDYEGTNGGLGSEKGTPIYR